MRFGGCQWGMGIIRGDRGRFSMSLCRAGFTPLPPTGRQNGGVNPALRRKGEVGLLQPRFWDEVLKRVRGTVFNIERAERTFGIRRILMRICGTVGGTR